MEKAKRCHAYGFIEAGIDSIGTALGKSYRCCSAPAYNLSSGLE